MKRSDFSPLPHEILVTLKETDVTIIHNNTRNTPYGGVQTDQVKFSTDLNREERTRGKAE